MIEFEYKDTWYSTQLKDGGILQNFWRERLKMRVEDVRCCRCCSSSRSGWVVAVDVGAGFALEVRSFEAHCNKEGVQNMNLWAERHWGSATDFSIGTLAVCGHTEEHFEVSRK